MLRSGSSGGSFSAETPTSAAVAIAGIFSDSPALLRKPSLPRPSQAPSSLGPLFFSAPGSAAPGLGLELGIGQGYEQGASSMGQLDTATGWPGSQLHHQQQQQQARAAWSHPELATLSDWQTSQKHSGVPTLHASAPAGWGDGGGNWDMAGEDSVLLASPGASPGQGMVKGLPRLGKRSPRRSVGQLQPQDEEEERGTEEGLGGLGAVAEAEGEGGADKANLQQAEYGRQMHLVCVEPSWVDETEGQSHFSGRRGVEEGGLSQQQRLERARQRRHQLRSSTGGGSSCAPGSATAAAAAAVAVAETGALEQHADRGVAGEGSCEQVQIGRQSGKQEGDEVENTGGTRELMEGGPVQKGDVQEQLPQQRGEGKHGRWVRLQHQCDDEIHIPAGADVKITDHHQQQQQQEEEQQRQQRQEAEQEQQQEQPEQQQPAKDEQADDHDSFQSPRVTHSAASSTRNLSPAKLFWLQREQEQKQQQMELGMKQQHKFPWSKKAEQLANQALAAAADGPKADGSPAQSPSKASWFQRLKETITCSSPKHTALSARLRDELKHRESEWGQQEVEQQQEVGLEVPAKQAPGGYVAIEQSEGGHRVNEQGKGAEMVACDNEWEQDELEREQEQSFWEGQQQLRQQQEGAVTDQLEESKEGMEEVQRVDSQQSLSNLQQLLHHQQQLQEQQQEILQQCIQVCIQGSATMLLGIAMVAWRSTQAPHLVQCGSLLHVPTLALLTSWIGASSSGSSTCSTAERGVAPSLKSRGKGQSWDALAAAVREQRVVLKGSAAATVTAAATAVSIAAAAAVAHWELALEGSWWTTESQRSASSVAPSVPSASAGDGVGSSVSFSHMRGVSASPSLRELQQQRDGAAQSAQAGFRSSQGLMHTRVEQEEASWMSASAVSEDLTASLSVSMVAGELGWVSDEVGMRQQQQLRPQRSLNQYISSQQQHHILGQQQQQSISPSSWQRHQQQQQEELAYSLSSQQYLHLQQQQQRDEDTPALVVEESSSLALPELQQEASSAARMAASRRSSKYDPSRYQLSPAEAAAEAVAEEEAALAAAMVAASTAIEVTPSWAQSEEDSVSQDGSDYDYADAVPYHPHRQGGTVGEEVPAAAAGGRTKHSLQGQLTPIPETESLGQMQGQTHGEGSSHETQPSLDLSRGRSSSANSLRPALQHLKKLRLSRRSSSITGDSSDLNPAGRSSVASRVAGGTSSLLEGDAASPSSAAAAGGTIGSSPFGSHLPVSASDPAEYGDIQENDVRLWSLGAATADGASPSSTRLAGRNAVPHIAGFSDPGTGQTELQQQYKQYYLQHQQQQQEMCLGHGISGSMTAGPQDLSYTGQCPWQSPGHASSSAYSPAGSSPSQQQYQLQGSQSPLMYQQQVSLSPRSPGRSSRIVYDTGAAAAGGVDGAEGTVDGNGEEGLEGRASASGGPHVKHMALGKLKLGSLQRRGFSGSGAGFSSGNYSGSQEVNLGDSYGRQQQDSPVSATGGLQGGSPQSRRSRIYAWGDIHNTSSIGSPTSGAFRSSRMHSQGEEYHSQWASPSRNASSWSGSAMGGGFHGMPESPGARGSGDGAGGGSSSGGAAKPFLKRRTRSAVSSKLDWSQVPSRTICHLEEK